MHILIMGKNYAPEKTGIGPFTTQLSEYLVQQGHKVTMVTTFPHYPEWKIQQNYKGNVLTREWVNGVHVYRSWIYVPSKQNALKRISYDSSFSFLAFMPSLMVRGTDIIVCISPPLQLGLMACAVNKLRGIPFLFHIQDLLPDIAVDLGMLRNKMVINFAYKLEKLIYHKASAIGIISQGFAEKVHHKGVPKSKMHYLPNWIDLEFVKPLDRNIAFRQKYGLKGSDFLVMYAGNIGNKQGLEVLLDANSILQKKKNIFVFIVGEGARKPALMRMANKTKMLNLQFLGFQPKEVLPEMLSSADVLIITQKAIVIDTCMPSKCLYYMASATPIVAAVNNQSETAKIIQEANAGLLVEAENPKALAEAILRLHGSAELREQLGTNGRSHVSEHFEKSKILKKFENLLVGIAKNGRRIKPQT